MMAVKVDMIWPVWQLTPCRMTRQTPSMDDPGDCAPACNGAMSAPAAHASASLRTLRCDFMCSPPVEIPLPVRVKMPPSAPPPMSVRRSFADVSTRSDDFAAASGHANPLIGVCRRRENHLVVAEEGGTY